MEDLFITPEGHKGFWAKSCLTKWEKSSGVQSHILRKTAAARRITIRTATIIFLLLRYITRFFSLWRFIVADGEVRIVCGDKEIIAGKDQAVFVDGMTPHSIWNNGDKTAVVIKISTERAKSDDEEESE